MSNFLQAFIPIFVAVDAIGCVPIFLGLTATMSKSERFRVIRSSLITALILTLGFILLGRIVFRYLGISQADFTVAGGIALAVLSILDLTRSPESVETLNPEEIGAVPIGTPLIAGPALLTISLICLDSYGMKATLASVIINIFIVGLALAFSSKIFRIIGKAGSIAITKILNLLMLAIAVMLIRKGLMVLVPKVFG